MRISDWSSDVCSSDLPPVFTVEESKVLRGELPGHHIKNLFLRNQKGQMWLVTCLEDRAVDLKGLCERIGAGRLSFGRADRLMTYLGVSHGAVTPFAVLPAKEEERKTSAKGKGMAVGVGTGE